MHDVNRCVRHDLNRHAHGSPHPTLTAASHHFDCTSSRTPRTSQLDCNRNPTSSPLPSLRDVGACNHNQQPLSARNNERGQGANKAEGEEEEGAYESNQMRGGVPSHMQCRRVLLHCRSSKKREVRLWRGSVHPTHCPVYVSCSLTSSTEQRVSHTPPCFPSLSFPQRHLQCQCNDTCPTSFTD